jgi:hypothetical protein
LERVLPGGDREVRTTREASVVTPTVDTLYLRVVNEDGDWRLCALSDDPFEDNFEGNGG